MSRELTTNFSERRWITTQAEAWLTARSLPVTPFNVLTAVDALGLLISPFPKPTMADRVRAVLDGIKEARAIAKKLDALSDHYAKTPPAIVRGTFDVHIGDDVVYKYEVPPRSEPGQPIAPDPQCDGCRWSWAERLNVGDAVPPGHCAKQGDRVEGCAYQERVHRRS